MVSVLSIWHASFGPNICLMTMPDDLPHVLTMPMLEVAFPLPANQRAVTHIDFCPISRHLAIAHAGGLVLHYAFIAHSYDNLRLSVRGYIVSSGSFGWQTTV